ncbi:hypothetical protein ABPG75_004110 [Micractinium tetrahymenae]
MVLLLLPWLFRGSSRPEYAALQASHGDDLAWEFGASAWILLGLVAARFAFNAALRGPTRRLAAAKAGLAADSSTAREGADAERDAGMEGRRLLEELWVTLGNVAMLAAALWVMLRRNGGCTFFNTSSCLAGWPNLPADPAVKLYYNFELAWYCHMLLKPVLRYGLTDGRDMLVHHGATLALILLSYGTNLTRMGVLVLSLFAISNPLLHIAKICNQLNLGPLKIGGFVAFALAFFLSRVLLVPWAVLKVALLDSRRQIPFAVEDFHGIWLFICVLLTALYAMQLVWMRGIVRVLRSAARHGGDAASRMSARLDPAKRYAVHAEPAEQQPQQQQAKQGAMSGAMPCNGSNGRVGGAQPKTPSPIDPPALAIDKAAAGKDE